MLRFVGEELGGCSADLIPEKGRLIDMRALGCSLPCCEDDDFSDVEFDGREYVVRLGDDGCPEVYVDASCLDRDTVTLILSEIYGVAVDQIDLP